MRTLAQRALTRFQPAPAGLLQRKCACGSSSAGGECEECNKEAKLQRRAGGGVGPAMAPPIVQEVLQSPGQPLDESTRTFFEPRFGHDFSKVRVHTDARATESARSVNALAYTAGPNVVFDSGGYQPGTTRGRKLLAHELTHVVQQGGRISGDRLRLNEPDGALEREADRTAASLTASDGRCSPAATHGPITLARKESGSPTGEQSPPTVYKHNTELGGLIVGNFDFHFKDCAILVWVWLKFQFTSDINAAEGDAFKKRFLAAIESVWGHSGWYLTGTGKCPCPMVPIEIHAQEKPGGHYHKRVDVERKLDFPDDPIPEGEKKKPKARRPKVIRDINVNLWTPDLTLAHEFGHVLGLYDEYDGGFWENLMFWHRNQPGDPNALMNIGDQLRGRYFEHYRKRVQKTAPEDCNYSVSSPQPPVGG